MGAAGGGCGRSACPNPKAAEALGEGGAAGNLGVPRMTMGNLISRSDVYFTFRVTWKNGNDFYFNYIKLDNGLHSSKVIKLIYSAIYQH